MTFLFRKWVQEPVNYVGVLIKVELVILTFKFDGFHVAKLELIWVVLVSPVELLLRLLHVHMLEIVREEEKLERINLVLRCHLDDFIWQHIAIERIQMAVVNVTTLHLTFLLAWCSYFLGVSRFNLEDDLAFDCFAIATILAVDVLERSLIWSTLIKSSVLFLGVL